jgi:hypothetical protein
MRTAKVVSSGRYPDLPQMMVRYLEEAELVGGLVGADDQGLDIADINVAACDGERWDIM